MANGHRTTTPGWIKNEDGAVVRQPRPRVSSLRDAPAGWQTVAVVRCLRTQDRRRQALARVRALVDDERAEWRLDPHGRAPSARLQPNSGTVLRLECRCGLTHPIAVAAVWRACDVGVRPRQRKPLTVDVARVAPPAN